MQREEVVYIDRDNTIEFTLSVDGSDISHTGITRCQIDIDGTVIDSETSPGAFDFTNANKLVLSLGSSNLTAGEYTAKLYIYDANSVNGYFWGDFPLIVTP